MRNKLKVYSFVAQNYGASSYYRVLTPLITAQEMGLPIEPIIDSNLEEINQSMRVRAFCESDVIYMHQPVGEKFVSNYGGAKSFLPSLVEGEWKYPPTLVVDSDDNLFNVNPHNPAFKQLGIRDPNGNPIPPGHTIGDVRNGKSRVLFVDGKDGFSVARNRANMDTYKTLLEMADAVTCTTDEVARTVQAEAKSQQVRVWPNLVRFGDYPQIDIAHKPGQITILWQGGGAHYEDWYPLKEALGRLTEKYSEVHWVIWGVLYHWVTELIPPDRYTFLNWCPYNEYKLRRVMFGEDISIAPLRDDRFNRCRSAIKFYEASVLKKPVATLAQNTGAYGAEILEGKTGLLWDTPEEFEIKLSRLIEDEKLRRELGENAKDWVSEHRDAYKHVPRWFDWLENLRTEIQHTQPHMPEALWDQFVKEQEEQERREMEEEESRNGEVDTDVHALPTV